MIIGDGRKTMEFSRALFDEGVLGTGIAFPTVPEGKARIRLMLTSEHRESSWTRRWRLWSGWLRGWGFWVTCSMRPPGFAIFGGGNRGRMRSTALRERSANVSKRLELGFGGRRKQWQALLELSSVGWRWVQAKGAKQAAERSGKDGSSKRDGIRVFQVGAGCQGTLGGGTRQAEGQGN